MYGGHGEGIVQGKSGETSHACIGDGRHAEPRFPFPACGPACSAVAGRGCCRHEILSHPEEDLRTFRIGEEEGDLLALEEAAEIFRHGTNQTNLGR